LIDTLRILLVHPSDEKEKSNETALGVEEGGIQSAEALLLARYFMYSQVYMHPIRRIYDIHLRDFLEEWLEGGKFSIDLSDHLVITDNEVTSAFLSAAIDKNSNGHLHAERIVKRKHFKLIYERNPNDIEVNPEAGKAVYKALCEHFDAEYFRHDKYFQKGEALDFPVRMRDDQIVPSLAISATLKAVPIVAMDYVFANRDILNKATKWLRENHDDIIKPEKEEEIDDEKT